MGISNAIVHAHSVHTHIVHGDIDNAAAYVHMGIYNAIVHAHSVHGT